MPHPDADRIRRLQRIAYGADSDDAARAAASTELAALLAPGDSGPPASSPDAASGTPADTAAPGYTGDDAVGIRSLRDRLRLRRDTIVVAATALAVGAVIGWVGGSTVGDAVTEPGRASAQPTRTPVIGFVDGPPSMSVESAPATDVFDREQTPADVPARPLGAGDTIDPSSTRLLAERDDVTRMFVGRHLDGPDVCMFVETPEVTAGTCTSSGVFPYQGLWVRGRGPSGTLGAFWMATGEAGFTVATTGSD